MTIIPLGQQTKICNSCKSEIPQSATKCKYCGSTQWTPFTAVLMLAGIGMVVYYGADLLNLLK